MKHGESPTFVCWLTFWELPLTLAILCVVLNPQSPGSPSNWLRNLAAKPGNRSKCSNWVWFTASFGRYSLHKSGTSKQVSNYASMYPLSPDLSLHVPSLLSFVSCRESLYNQLILWVWIFIHHPAFATSQHCVSAMWSWSCIESEHMKVEVFAWTNGGLNPWNRRVHEQFG